MKPMLILLTCGTSQAAPSGKYWGSVNGVPLTLSMMKINQIQAIMFIIPGAGFQIDDQKKFLNLCHKILARTVIYLGDVIEFAKDLVSSPKKELVSERVSGLVLTKSRP